VLELSRKQQVSQCCGLAAAMNNASLAKFPDTLVNISALMPDDKIDLNVMLQVFKEVESNYLFKPEILPESANFSEIKSRNEYVRQFGQEEFDNLKSLVEHFQGKPAQSNSERYALLDSFDDKLKKQNDLEQTDRKLEYIMILYDHYNTLMDK
jgi:hypothetical protein